MEQHANSQSPSNQGWTCAKAKTHHFPIFDLGGGWGSKFYFILSKTAIMDTIKWNSKNPNTRKSRWSFVTTKTRHFPIFDLLWGGSKFSIYFVPDCGCRSCLLKFHKYGVKTMLYVFLEQLIRTVALYLDISVILCTLWTCIKQVKTLTPPLEPLDQPLP